MAAPSAARTVSSSRIATNVRISLIAWILQQEQQVAQAEQTLRISLLRDCRAQVIERTGVVALELARQRAAPERIGVERDRKSTRLNSSHSQISYAVFCLKKKRSFSATTVRRRRAALATESEWHGGLSTV